MNDANNQADARAAHGPIRATPQKKSWRPLKMPGHTSALWPLVRWLRRPRWINRIYAHQCGFYWLPCRICGRYYGGHEGAHEGLKPKRPGLAGHSVCWRCGDEAARWNASQVHAQAEQPAETFPPGQYIEGEMMARGWDVDELADRVHLQNATVVRLINGTTRINDCTAVLLAFAFGTSPELWLNMEATYRNCDSVGAGGDNEEVEQNPRCQICGEPATTISRDSEEVPWRESDFGGMISQRPRSTIFVRCDDHAHEPRMWRYNPITYEYYLPGGGEE